MMNQQGSPLDGLTLKQQFEFVHALINENRYAEARALLRQIDHPKAAEWIERLNLLDPAVNPFSEPGAGIPEPFVPEQSAPAQGRLHPLERMEQESAAAQSWTAGASGANAQTNAQTSAPPISLPDTAKPRNKVSVGALVFALIGLLIVLGLGLMRFIPRSYTSTDVHTALPNQWFVAGENGDTDCQQAVAPGSSCVLLLQRAEMGAIPSALIGTHFPISAGANVIIIVSRATLPSLLPVDQVHAIIEEQLENDALLNTISPSFSNVQAGDRIERVVLGENAQGIQFTATLNSGDLPVDIWGQFILFPHDGNLYELDVFAEPASQWSRYTAEVDTILNSMAFVE